MYYIILYIFYIVLHNLGQFDTKPVLWYNRITYQLPYAIKNNMGGKKQT